MNQVFALLALQDSGSSSSSLLGFVPVVAIVAVMYLVVLRPQMKERKRIDEEAKAFRDSLKNGDRVVTSGGILGVVTSVRDDTVQLRIADAVKIEVLRTAVASRQAESATQTDAK